jgi:hypothetical protein
MKVLKKVNYSEYEGKYNKSIKERLEKAPERVDVETLRANLYGYTYTKEYAAGEIPDEFSMDYWEERHEEIGLENLNFEDCEILDNPDSLLEDVDDNPYFDVSPQEKLLLETIDSTGDGKTPETALCVIDVNQEYEYIQRIVRLSVLQIVGQNVKKGIDCLEMKDFDGRIEKIYFDITRRFDVSYFANSYTSGED